MDTHVRDTERRALADPSAWRALVAAFDRARDRCDAALPDADLHAPRPLPREERQAALAVAEADADLCLCGAFTLPHSQHIGRRRRRKTA